MLTNLIRSTEDIVLNEKIPWEASPEEDSVLFEAYLGQI